MPTFSSISSEHHKPTADYVRTLRIELAATYPSATFAFLPADMIGQILNFGLPSPIDVQVVGFNVAGEPRIRQSAAAEAAQQFRARSICTSTSRATIRSSTSTSTAARRSCVGLTEQAVASNMLVSLSGSFQTSPSFWIDPKSGTQYQVATQTPQFRLENLNDLGNTPLERRPAAPRRSCRASRTSIAASRRRW